MPPGVVGGLVGSSSTTMTTFTESLVTPGAVLPPFLAAAHVLHARGPRDQQDLDLLGLRIAVRVRERGLRPDPVVEFRRRGTRG